MSIQNELIVAARALATYVIPGCVGRGVRLGSENSSGGAAGAAGGGVWKSGNLEIWEFGDLGIWRPGDLEIQKFGDLGTWKIQKCWVQKMEKTKILKIQSVLPKMSARSGLVGKKTSWPHLRPPEAIFSMDRKNQKMLIFCLFSLVGLWALFTRCGPLLLSTRGGAIDYLNPVM